MRENHHKARPSTDDPGPQIIKRSDSDKDSEVPAVIDCIQRNSGNMDKAWKTSEFIPLIVKYYSGVVALRHALLLFRLS
jgi:hypothetical protein